MRLLLLSLCLLRGVVCIHQTKAGTKLAAASGGSQLRAQADSVVSASSDEGGDDTVQADMQGVQGDEAHWRRRAGKGHHGRRRRRSAKKKHPTPKPAPRPAPRPPPRPASRPAPRPAPRPASRPAPRPAPRSAPRPASRPAPRPSPAPEAQASTDAVQWIQASMGQSCTMACKARSSTCEASKLVDVDTKQEILDVARQAGVTCKSKDSTKFAATVGWGYDANPGQCTHDDCCGGQGPCKGICAYGISKSKNPRSCEARNAHYSRFCPCRKADSLTPPKVKCPAGTIRSMAGKCVKDCPPGQISSPAKDGATPHCVFCDGESRRRRGSNKCDPCASGHINKVDTDECQNVQDTCTPDQCKQCARCMDDAAPHLEKCYRQHNNHTIAPGQVRSNKVSAALTDLPRSTDCLDLNTQWCHSFMGQLFQCEGFSFGCYFKLLCNSPCICPEWKLSQCGNKTSEMDSRGREVKRKKCEAADLLELSSHLGIKFGEAGDRDSALLERTDSADISQSMARRAGNQDDGGKAVAVDSNGEVHDVSYGVGDDHNNKGGAVQSSRKARASSMEQALADKCVEGR